MLGLAWLLGLAIQPVLAISTGNCVAFDNKAGGFQVASTNGVKVLVDPDEWPGVARAAGDLAKDLSTVRIA